VKQGHELGIYTDCRYRRREINDAIKDLRNGVIPFWRPSITGDAPAEFETILACHREAIEAADDQWKAEVAATPTDDAAWERELRWRLAFDAGEILPRR
jgi:hypothetical protein